MIKLRSFSAAISAHAGSYHQQSCLLTDDPLATKEMCSFFKLIMTQLDRGLVHTTQRKFKNSVFTLKAHQKFSVHTTLERFENAAISSQFGFEFDENSVREIT